MHNFVVREGKHEIFIERVEESEGKLILMIHAMDGIVAEVVEHVVHPSHVPFKGESQPSRVGRP